MRVEDRKAARLLVLDREGRMLLFRHRDPFGRSFWATPGDVTFPWGDRLIVQHERYFLAAIDPARISFGPSHVEEGVEEVPWWSPDELARDATVRPPDICERLRALEEKP